MRDQTVLSGSHRILISTRLVSTVLLGGCVHSTAGRLQYSWEAAADPTPNPNRFASTGLVGSHICGQHLWR